LKEKLKNKRDIKREMTNFYTGSIFNLIRATSSSLKLESLSTIITKDYNYSDRKSKIHKLRGFLCSRYTNLETSNRHTSCLRIFPSVLCFLLHKIYELVLLCCHLAKLKMPRVPYIYIYIYIYIYNIYPL
jgi:hypothetical protein